MHGRSSDSSGGSAPELGAFLDQIDATVRSVRERLDLAWRVAYRALAPIYLAVGSLFVAFDLLELPSGYSPSELLSAALSFSTAGAFYALAGLYAWAPERQLRRQRSSQRWLRRVFLRASVPDSRLAEAMDQLAMMQREIRRIDEMTAFFWLFYGMLTVGLAGLAWLSLARVLEPGLSSWRPPAVPGVAAAGIAVATGVAVAVLIGRSRAGFREARELSQELTRWQYTLGQLQQAFWGRY